VDLSLPGGRITAGPDVLPDGLTITLEVLAPSIADSLPNVPPGMIITDIVRLGLSEPVRGAGPVTLSAGIAGPIPARFRGYILAEGGDRFHEISEPAWSPEVAQFDTATSELTFQVFAGATRFSLVGVEMPDDTVASTRAVSVSPWKTLTRFVSDRFAAFAFAQEEPPGQPIVWLSHGWAVVCDPRDIGNSGLVCDLAPQFADVFPNADSFLTSLGLAIGWIQVGTIAEIDRGGFSVVAIGDPDLRSGTGAEARYMIAYLRPPGFAGSGGGIGNYDRNTGHLDVSPSPQTLINGVLDELAVSTVVHELTHAAQAVEIPKVNLDETRWITEGTSMAVEVKYMGEGSPYVLALGARDWSFRLDANVESYRTREFWLANDPSLSGLAAFYRDLTAQLIPINETNSYASANSAFRSTGRPGLQEQYVNLIAAKAIDPTYPYCLAGRCEIGGDCASEAIQAVGSLAVLCIDMEVIDDSCPEQDPRVALVPLAGDSSDWRFFVSGLEHDAGEPVETGPMARVWVVNRAMSQPGEPANTPPNFRFEAESGCRCGNGVTTTNEECDDGNLENGDGCDSSCLVEFCGNGRAEGLEECDDGNLEWDDGCAGCVVENICYYQAASVRVHWSSTYGWITNLIPFTSGAIICRDSGIYSNTPPLVGQVVFDLGAHDAQVTYQSGPGPLRTKESLIDLGDARYSRDPICGVGCEDTVGCLNGCANEGVVCGNNSGVCGLTLGGFGSPYCECKYEKTRNEGEVIGTYRGFGNDWQLHLDLAAVGTYAIRIGTPGLPDDDLVLTFEVPPS
jgi:cysteine-rich repeat protein